MKMKHTTAAILTAITLSASATQPSGTLPVVYLNTENGIEITGKDQGYVNATYWLDANGTEFESVGSAEAPVATEIKARGNYTWTGFDKKPYKLKLDKKTKLLGMDNSKHFALLAHADDNLGFMRNALGFELARRMGLAWTPEMVPVEYVHNGDYKGLYFMTQTIRADEARVNVTEMADFIEDPDNASDPAQASGGWIVEVDNYDADPHITIMEHWTDEDGNKYPIWFTYDKSMDNASPVQLEWLTNSLGRINDLIYAEDKADSSELESLLDFDSLARFYLVQELMDNTESFHGSCYLFRERGDESKWTFGPVWDFGSSMFRGNWDGHFYAGSYHNVWIEELVKFPAFQSTVKSVWAEFCAENYAGIDEFLTSYINGITEAASTDKERWPQYGNDDLQGKMQNVLGMLKHRVKVIGNWFGAQPVEPLDIYLRGTMNGWNDLSLKFEYQTDGTYSMHLDTLEGEFKIATEDWTTVDYGAPTDTETRLKKHEPYFLSKIGANIKIHNDEVLNDVRVIFNPAAETLLVSDPSGVVDVESAARPWTVSGLTVTALSPVTVVTPDGRTAAMLGEGQAISLPAGLYIIISGSHASKVALR